MVDLKILGLLAFHALIIGLPVLAAMLFAARRGVGSVAMLLAIGLAVSGILALATFWAYYGGRTLGEVLSYLVPLGSIALIGFSLWGWRPERSQAIAIATPLALWLLGCGFIVFLGFLHGGAESPIAYASTRFSGQLPSDNDIPHFFTEWFFLHGHNGPPPLYPGSWSAADRPPLQVGYGLAQRPWFWNQNALDYQLIAVCLQQFWILGLWALLSAAGVNRLTKALAMITILFSDVAIVNGFFVWPKMLPTAMVLAAAAILLTPLWNRGRHDWRVAALVAALAGIAMLGHGSSIFALIPLALVALWRGLPSWRWIGAGVAVGIIVMAPWSAYQKYGDPPGTRLDHWMLAGRVGVTEVERGEFPASLTGEDGEHESPTESTVEAIKGAYGEVGFGGAIHNKAENFVTIFGGGPAVHYAKTAVQELGHGHFGKALENVRWILFFYLVPSLGLLVFAPLIMLFARRRVVSRIEWDLAKVLYGVFAVGTVIWALLLFGNTPSRAAIQSGTYFMPVIGLVAGVIGLRAVLPRFAVWYSAIAAGLMLILYIPAVGVEWGTENGYSALAAIFAVAFGIGFCALVLRAGREKPEVTPATRHETGALVGGAS
jgi:hypothetical protein